MTPVLSMLALGIGGTGLAFVLASKLIGRVAVAVASDPVLTVFQVPPVRCCSLTLKPTVPELAPVPAGQKMVFGAFTLTLTM